MNNARIIELLHEVTEGRPLIITLIEENSSQNGKINWNRVMRTLKERPEILQDTERHITGANALHNLIQRACRQ